MMTKFVYHAAILAGIVSSLMRLVHSGSASDGLIKKSGFDSSYHGYLGEYSAGKALGEIHSFGESSSRIVPEHENHFDDEGEAHFSESFGQHQSDDGHSSHFESYSGGFEPSKFPSDIESHHYTGGGSSGISLGEEDHQHQEHHQFEHHHGYQFDEPAKSSDFKGFHGFHGTQIVPYIGNEEAEHKEEQLPKYSGQEDSHENDVIKNPSHGHSYEAPEKVPTSSYSHSYEGSKVPSSSYSSSYEATKSPSSSFESIKAPGLAHEYSLGSYKTKYQHHHSVSAPEAPSKVDIVHKFKSSGLKSFHSAPLQKNIMTINHGKGGYSFSSLYRS